MSPDPSFLVYRAQLQRQLDDTEFRRRVAAELLNIRTAAPGSSRKSAAGLFAVFVQRTKLTVRLRLATDLMNRLHVTTTQHVGRYVMQSVFGYATATHILDDRFAKPGRTAAEKHMKEAREKLAARTDLQEDYKSLYSWYCSELRRAIDDVKASELEGWDG